MIDFIDTHFGVRGFLVDLDNVKHFVDIQEKRAFILAEFEGHGWTLGSEITDAETRALLIILAGGMA